MAGPGHLIVKPLMRGGRQQDRQPGLHHFVKAVVAAGGDHPVEGHEIAAQREKMAQRRLVYPQVGGTARERRAGPDQPDTCLPCGCGDVARQGCIAAKGLTAQRDQTDAPPEGRQPKGAACGSARQGASVRAQEDRGSTGEAGQPSQFWAGGDSGPAVGGSRKVARLGHQDCVLGRVQIGWVPMWLPHRAANQHKCSAAVARLAQSPCHKGIDATAVIKDCGRPQLGQKSRKGRRFPVDPVVIVTVEVLGGHALHDLVSGAHQNAGPLRKTPEHHPRLRLRAQGIGDRQQPRQMSKPNAIRDNSDKGGHLWCANGGRDLRGGRTGIAARQQVPYVVLRASCGLEP